MLKPSRLLKALVDWVFPRRCVRCGSLGSYICESCVGEVLDPLVLCIGDLKLYSAGSYGDFKPFIWKFKYEGVEALGEELGAILAGVIEEKVDAVTWVPSHRLRVRERGYEHTEILARHVAKFLGVEAVKLLERIKYTVPQVELGRDKRVENVKGAFVGVGSFDGKVLLVDDVVTTGSTILEAARVLSAKEVILGCVCVERV